MIKIYKYKKKNNVVANFRLGNKTFRITFSGGYVFNGQDASYTTKNPLEQIAIENDSRFGSEIFIAQTFPEPSDAIVENIKKANAKKSDESSTAKTKKK